MLRRNLLIWKSRSRIRKKIFTFPFILEEIQGDRLSHRIYKLLFLFYAKKKKLRRDDRNCEFNPWASPSTVETCEQ